MVPTERKMTDTNMRLTDYGFNMPSRYGGVLPAELPQPPDSDCHDCGREIHPNDLGATETLCARCSGLLEEDETND